MVAHPPSKRYKAKEYNRKQGKTLVVVTFFL